MCSSNVNFSIFHIKMLIISAVNMFENYDTSLGLKVPILNIWHYHEAIKQKNKKKPNNDILFLKIENTHKNNNKTRKKD